MSNRKNCLSFWYPKIEAAGLPVPKTEIVRHGSWMIGELRQAAETVGGYPVFLRTGHGSGKHRWNETCYVPDREAMPDHVAALVEWSATAGVNGLPTDVWAVREMLPTKPVLTLPAYGGMPLCREFRVFVRDAEVLCSHPYWPWASVKRGFPINTKQPPEFADDWLERIIPPGAKDKWKNLCRLNPFENLKIEQLASRAGAAVGGEWSVDLLETDRGWMVIDMAVASESWHWPGCPVAKELGK